MWTLIQMTQLELFFFNNFLEQLERNCMNRLPEKAIEDVNSILRQKSLGTLIGFD